MISAALKVTRGRCPLCQLKRSPRFVLSLTYDRATGKTSTVLQESAADTALCRDCWRERVGRAIS